MFREIWIIVLLKFKKTETRDRKQRALASVFALYKTLHEKLTVLRQRYCILNCVFTQPRLEGDLLISVTLNSYSIEAGKVKTPVRRVLLPAYLECRSAEGCL